MEKHAKAQKNNAVGNDLQESLIIVMEANKWYIDKQIIFARGKPKIKSNIRY